MHLLTEKSLETLHCAAPFSAGSIINCNKSWPFKLHTIIWGVADATGSVSGSIYGLFTICAKSK